MATHSLRIVFDDQDTPVITHIARTELMGHNVSCSETVELADTEGATAALQTLLDANREEMERRVQASAITHAAAVAGVRKKGEKILKLGGTLGAMGASQQEKS